MLVGGTAGTAARHGVVLAVPDIHDVPVAVLFVNLIGAFLLGALLGAVGSRTDRPARTLRLLLGTGFLGGFTTYSALAADTVLLGADGRPGTASAYALLTVVAGGAATLAGILLTAASRDRRTRR